jgi:hypothetical protein
VRKAGSGASPNQLHGCQALYTQLGDAKVSRCAVFRPASAPFLSFPRTRSALLGDRCNGPRGGLPAAPSSLAAEWDRPDLQVIAFYSEIRSPIHLTEEEYDLAS